MFRHLGELMHRLAREHTRGIRARIHAFALGMTLALAVPLAAQGCVAGGQ
jgi:hypothetical protein